MDNLTISVDGAVAVVTIDRPPVNALDRVTMLELTETFRGFAHSRDVNAVVFTGAGDRAFCAGADLSDSAKRFDPEARAAGDPADQTQPGRLMWETFAAVKDCAVPVVAAVNAAAIGAGVALVALCDVVVASTEARFALTEINVGVLGAASQAERWLGPYKARRMFFGGDFVTADELYRRGAVESVHAPGELMAGAMEIAQLFASKSPIAMRLAKESINRVEGKPVLEAYRLEQDYTERLKSYEDSAEAAAANREKRPPRWRWR